MKTTISAIALSMIILISSCKKSDDNSNNISASAINSTVVSGNWRVSYYWDTNHDETANYAGYNFVFAGGNSLTATNGGSVVTGTWSTGTDDSQTKLILSFTSPASFAEISDDWHVTSRTDTKIVMQDVSGGNGGTDYLTIEKN